MKIDLFGTREPTINWSALDLVNHFKNDVFSNYLLYLLSSAFSDVHTLIVFALKKFKKETHLKSPIEKWFLF